MPKASSFYLTIPQPCQQAWEEMTSDTRGRFCGHCNKTVVDFTAMSDEEVLAMMRTSTTKLCGRFQASQLNRPLYQLQKRHQNTLLPAVMITSALMAGVTSESTAHSTNTYLQTPDMVTSSVGQHQAPAISNPLSATTQDTLPVISGRVLDNDSSQAIPGTLIRIKGTEHKTFTDSSGYFRLTIPDSLKEQPITLFCLSVGYERQELTLSDRSYSKPVEISLHMNQFVLGGAQAVVVVTAQSKPTFWQKVKRLFR